MKAKIRNYIEVPLTELIKEFPEIMDLCPELDVTDENYIVRFDGEKMEIGYASDRWGIGNNEE